MTNALSGGLTDAVLMNGNASQNGKASGYVNLRWSGVTLGPGTASVKLTGVRADASSLGVWSNVPVLGQVSVNTIVPVAVSYAPQATACGASTAGGPEIMACAAPSMLFQKSSPATCPAQTIVPLIYQESNPASFHTGVGGTRLRMVLSKIPGTVQVYAPVYPNEGSTRAQLFSADANGREDPP